MIDVRDVASFEIFAALDARSLARIVARAADLHVRPGEWIVSEGDPPAFWVVLEGEVEALRSFGGLPRHVTTFDAGEFFGEVPLMLGIGANASIRALVPTRMMRIEGSDFHAMIVESPAIGALVARTLVRRVGIIREHFTEASLVRATIVGDRYDLGCHDLRDFFSRNQMPFDWLDPTNPNDRDAIPAEARDLTAYPVVIFPDGRIVNAPTLSALARELGLQIEPDRQAYDLVIVGGGPAGLAAAVYGGSEGLRTLLIEREATGGQAGTSSRIKNYLGFPNGISGGDLASRALVQAKRFGSEIVVTQGVAAIDTAAQPGAPHHIRLESGTIVATRAIALATGVTWRRLAAEGADRLVGRGVYYGAARTEARGARGKDVFLIGGGNSAGQAAMFFANYARSVTLLVRGASLAASMSHYLIEQLASRDNVAVEVRTTVRSVAGAAHLERIVTVDEATGIAREREAAGLFVFIGADAETAWIPAAIERDARGYVRTGHDLTTWPLERSPFDLETSVPGIFAAGDVRSNSVKRVAAGVGEGSMLVAFVHRYLETVAAPTAHDAIAS